MYNIALISFLSLSCSCCAARCVIAMMPKWLDILTRPGQANNCCSVFNFHSLKYLGLFVLFQCATSMYLLLSVFLNCCNSISHTISQLYFSAEKYLRLFVLYELPPTVCSQVPHGFTYPPHKANRLSTQLIMVQIQNCTLAQGQYIVYTQLNNLELDISTRSGQAHRKWADPDKFVTQSLRMK